MASVKEIIDRYNPSQGNKECAALIKLVKKIEPQTIVEIGVHEGRSLAVWQEVFKPTKLIGIDPETTYRLEAYLKHELPDAIMLQGESQTEVIRGRLVAVLGGDDIDFAFIDGSHTYEDAKADFDYIIELMRPGGIIAIHDVGLTDNKWAGLVETAKLFKEISSDDNFRTELIQSDGSGVGVVYV